MREPDGQRRGQGCGPWRAEGLPLGARQLVQRALQQLHHHRDAAVGEAARAEELADARVAQTGQHGGFPQNLVLPRAVLELLHRDGHAEPVACGHGSQPALTQPPAELDVRGRDLSNGGLGGGRGGAAGVQPTLAQLPAELDVGGGALSTGDLGAVRFDDVNRMIPK